MVRPPRGGGRIGRCDRSARSAVPKTWPGAARGNAARPQGAGGGERLRRLIQSRPGGSPPPARQRGGEELGVGRFSEYRFPRPPPGSVLRTSPPSPPLRGGVTSKP